MIEQLVQNQKIKLLQSSRKGPEPLTEKSIFYRGFIYLFRTSDLGILPVTLNGFYDLKPKNRFYINFDSKLDVIIHKPIKREELIEKSDTEIIETVKAIIESA